MAARACRARVTLARISLADAVQTNGFGLALCLAILVWIGTSSSGTDLIMPLRMRFSVMSRKNRSTLFNHDERVGVT